MLMVLSNTFCYRMPGYDTLHLWLPKEQVSNTNLLEEIPPLLSKLKQGYDYHTHETNFTGNFRNIRVIVKDAGVYTTGSICKYLLNNNLQTLNLKQTKDAIKMLSDELRLPMYKADVKRIDIAENFAMNFDVSFYYQFLGKARYYTRLEQNNGIYYRNSKKEMLFYGKQHEMKLKGFAIPEAMQGQNELRYEFRFARRLCEQFNLPELKANQICNEKFYKEILTRWEAEYFKIPKIRLPNFDLNNLHNMKAFEKQVLLKGIESFGGESAMMQRIEQAKKQGIFKNKMQVKRIKDKVKTLCSTRSLTFESDAILELDRKVKEATKF